jgi:uncharacterized protein (TIGR02118 family)
MKSKIVLLFAILIVANGCATNKISNSQVNQKGLIKLTLLYPNGEGKTFDWDYYTNKHYPLLKKYFGDSMKSFELDKGESSGIPNTPVPYVAIAYLYFENVEAFQNVMKKNGAEIMADIPKYTNISPVVQISEVVQ